MGFRGDFLELLGPDISTEILMCLEDPSDIVRASAVSSTWRACVIANGLSKHLFRRNFPEISSAPLAIEVKNILEPVKVNLYESTERACLERDHRVYAFLTRGLASSLRTDCISKAIYASSTDNYPEESIQNTLEPSDRVDHRTSYWSSKGESDPAVPETLMYKLISKLCVVSEIHVEPFQAYFQFGFPIYSARAVRFRMGHLKPYTEVDSDNKDQSAASLESSYDMFTWTYISPDYPMAQENCLQKFKLPEPVLCIGGILQVELLGRVQQQEMDGLYYICVSHVQVVGRPLSPPFDIEIQDQSGEYNLKYHQEERHNVSVTRSTERKSSGPSRFHRLTESIRGLEQMIVNTLLGGGAVVVEDDDSDE